VDGQRPGGELLGELDIIMRPGEVAEFDTHTGSAASTTTRSNA
jgi:hypothetical protein